MKCKRKYLFCCESSFQLFNAINIKMNLFQKEKADLYLSDQTDFSAIVDKLKQIKIFENVCLINSKPISTRFYNSRLEEQIDYFRHPEILLDGIPNHILYDEYFIPIDHIFWKLLFYRQLNSTKAPPIIHFYEEGLRTYTMDIETKEMNEAFNQNYYGAQSFAKSIVDFYVYEPKLFSNSHYLENVFAIPKVEDMNSEFVNILLHIFPTCKPPDEKFIFFEESYLGDKCLSNDVQLFDQIAKIVGKENIIVKLHPRNKIDRFSIRGYKVLPNRTTPWEVQLLRGEYANKFFITVSSTASLSPMLVYNQEVKSIHLLKMFIGKSPLLQDSLFHLFYTNMVSLYNSRTINIYQPYCIEECKEVLNYWISQFG